MAVNMLNVTKNYELSYKPWTKQQYISGINAVSLFQSLQIKF